MVQTTTTQSRREFLKTSTAALVGATTMGSATATGTETETPGPSQQGPRENVVATWMSAQEPPDEENISGEGFQDQTLRQIVHTSIGGNKVRVRLANTFGDEPVTLGNVTVAHRKEGVALSFDEDVDHFGHVVTDYSTDGAAVVEESVREVTFGGESTITIPAGGRAYSDPVPLEVEPQQDLAVSLYAPEPTGPATWHHTPKKPTYLGEGDQTDAVNPESFTTTIEASFFLDGVDVVNPDAEGTIVMLGDSITDGTGSSLDANNTYPQYFARRVNDAPEIRKSVVNAGIAGNEVVDSTGVGPAALARFDRDVLGQSGVTDIILLEGINDIGSQSEEETPSTAEEVIWGLKQLAARAHAKGLRIYVGTLIPSLELTRDYYDFTETSEEERQKVNEWIRSNDVFDGVIDFDRAVRDPENPKVLRSEYDSSDGQHPSDAGYEAMAKAIDLDMIRREDQ